MRYTVSLLLVLLCYTASGQKFCMSLRGGLAFNSTPFKGSPEPILASAYGRKAMALGFRTMMDFKHWQVGTGIDYGRYKFGVASLYGHGKTLGYVPCVYPHLYAAGKLTMHRAYVYLGVTAGYNLQGITTTTTLYDGKEWKLGHNASTFTGGIVAGYSRQLARHWFIFAEAAARYLPMRTGILYYNSRGMLVALQDDVEVFTVPITVGITCRM